MKPNLKALAALALALILPYGIAQTSSSPKSKKKPTASEAAVQAQIDALRNDMQSQIQSLKQQLSEKDAQLQQAQQAAAAAQAAAQQAQQAAQQAQQANATNTEAVTSLQGAVTDLKTNNASLAQTVQDNQKQTKTAIENPDVIHFKGITLSPTGSFLAAETVWRQRATGGGINTSYSALPLAYAPQYYYSEFYGSGRQSRLALLGEGKIQSMTMRGYYEADFLSAGVTSNNNESNSYTLRQRQVWAQAELPTGWTFTGGQMWSLATETAKGITNRTENLPPVIDPQYVPGFVWERQYGFRVTKAFQMDKANMWLAVSAENAQIPSVSGHNLPINFLVGQAGTGGGLYNTTANYASSVAPDIILKAVFEPKWKIGGHYEVFGLATFMRDRVYPDVAATPASSIGAYNSTSSGGGIGGSLRIPTFQKKLDVGLSGLWGDGVGRYGDAQVAETTVHPNGTLALIHAYSALGTLIWHATPRLDVYTLYGGDGALRTYYLTSPTKAVGYGSYLNNTGGCYVEVPPATGNTGYTPPGAPSTCVADTKDVQQFTAGYWYDFYKGPMGRLRQGFAYSYAQRFIWSGLNGGSPSAGENMWWTSFRYYLP
jgi:hypothetical protein